MKIGFEKPVGSHADVCELEYIAALHQTGPTLRRDGSIDASDIVWMLLSRFGVAVTQEVIEKEVLRDFVASKKHSGSGESSSSSAVLDLRQVASLLLIPHLVRCAKDAEDTEAQAEEDNAQNITRDNTSVACMAQQLAALHNVGSEEDHPVIIDKDFVRKLLLHLQIMTPDEIEKLEEGDQEALLEEMVEAAGGEGTEFNANSFLQALTKDITLGYNLNWENRLSTSYADILGGGTSTASSGASGYKHDKQEHELVPNKDEAEEISENSTLAPEIIPSQFADKAKKVPGMAGIDNTADLFGSSWYASIQWVVFLLLFVVYVYGTGKSTMDTNCGDAEYYGENGESYIFGCQIANSIVAWFVIFAQLIILGGAFFLLSSMGNSAFLPQYGSSNGDLLLSMARILVSMGTVVLFCIVPIVVQWDTWLFSTDWVDQDQTYTSFAGAAIGVGCVLLLIQLKSLVRILCILLAPSSTESNSCLQRWLSHGAAKKDRYTKRAATFKTNKMVSNALGMHTSTKIKDNHNNHHHHQQQQSTVNANANNGIAMTNFLRTAQETELTGSLTWAWKSIWNGSIFQEEGVWFHARLIASAIVQVFVILISLTLFLVLLNEVQQRYDLQEQGWDGTFTTTACSRVGECRTYFAIDNAPQLSLAESLDGSLASNFGNASVSERAQFLQEMQELVYNRSGVNISSTNIGGLLLLDDLDELTVESVYNNGINWLVGNAEQSEVTFGIAIGFTFSILSTVWIVIGYMPSYVFNVMRFRYGIIPSLCSSDFQLLRNAPDHSTLVFGMAFWAQLFTAILQFVVPGAVAFFLVWSGSKTLVQGFLAQLIGILVTIIVKILILLGFRRLLIAGFYRKNQAGTNILFMLIECWNIALSAGFLVARTAIFVLLAMCYLGRIDTPFLAPNVDRFDAIPNLFLDKGPVCYRKDLLLHEAHRHPYLDRLAAIYLLKLNLGDSFATRAGSCWRLIYVLALMPWLQKYKLKHTATGQGDDDKRIDYGDDNSSRKGGSSLPKDIPPSSKTLRESALEDEVSKLRAETLRLHCQLENMATKKESQLRDSVLSV